MVTLDTIILVIIIKKLSIKAWNHTEKQNYGLGDYS